MLSDRHIINIILLFNIFFSGGYALRKEDS